MRQVGFLLIDVIDFEKSGGSFARGRSEHGRVGEGVTLAVHEFAGGAHRLRANAENRGLARRSNPEMTVVQEKVDAMFFQLDGEGRALRDFLDDLDFRDAQFVAAGGAFLRADLSGDDDAGFLSETLQRFERFRILLQGANALDDSRAVAKNRKQQFSRLAKVIKPSLESNFLSVEFPRLLNGDDRHRLSLLCRAHFADTHSFSNRAMALRAAAS